MAENLDPNQQIKEFDLKEHKWLINGKWYYLLTKMPPRRYVEYLKLLPEVFFNTTFKGMYDTLSKIWQNSTSGNDVLGALHSNAELAYNQMASIVDLDRKEVPKILEFCAIILVREGEYLSECDENTIRDKVDDFMSDTYSVQSFFFLAMHSVPHFTEIYNKLKQDLNSTISEAASV